MTEKFSFNLKFMALLVFLLSLYEFIVREILLKLSRKKSSKKASKKNSKEDEKDRL